MLAITNSRFFDGTTFREDFNIFIENEKISDISADRGLSGYKIIDAGNNLLVPGLIDLQIYGSGGHLFSAQPTAQTLEEMDQDLLNKGTTSFLACVATNTQEVTDKAIIAAKNYRSGARGFLGLHLEGPYLNPKRRGAHIEAFIRKASLDEIKKLLDNGDGVIKMMTIAPETQEDNVIHYLIDNNVVLSLGHSNATFIEATNAYNKGIATTTHLFNAMSPLHHREPGIPTAAFNHPSAMSSIIADGYHVDFEVIRTTERIMGNRLFLISDAVTACNEGPYQHRLQGDKFITADGTLSGSNITMLQAVQNCVEHCGISIARAINMATANPASLLKSEIQT
ncbi:MAG: N-acetylglucosamine-6-phosphate deacetylase, partial [Sphingobacteriales bacterium]